MESRIQQAFEKKTSGKYNCAQAVACTYCDIVGMDEETMRDVTNAFGVGMGNMEGTCGALVGAGIILGMKTHDRAKAMAAMKGVMTKFKQRNQSTICNELKGIKTRCPLRQCNDCVADAAEFLENAISEMD